MENCTLNRVKVLESRLHTQFYFWEYSPRRRVGEGWNLETNTTVDCLYFLLSLWIKDPPPCLHSFVAQLFFFRCKTEVKSSVTLKIINQRTLLYKNIFLKFVFWSDSMSNCMIMKYRSNLLILTWKQVKWIFKLKANRG